MLLQRFKTASFVNPSASALCSKIIVAMAAAGVSPSSSPRLPSPPPFTEVQIGPKSPSVGESFGNDAEQMLGPAHGGHDGSTRRIRPGTKAADMAFGPPLVELAQVRDERRQCAFVLGNVLLRRN